jgi:hypothetical protein
MSIININNQNYHIYEENNIIEFINTNDFINTIYNNQIYEENNITEIINIINTYINNQEPEQNVPSTNPNENFVNINFVLETIDTSTDDDLNCCICMESKENHEICQLNCQHKFCSECIVTLVNRNRNNSECPLCRTQIDTITVQTDDDLYNLINI